MSNERYVIHVTKQCNMKCVYCVSGDTKILMSDFTEKEIKDIVVGDEILGFDEDQTITLKGKLHTDKSVVEQVHNRLSNVYNVTFDNGENLMITGNHKILLNRPTTPKGSRWKPVENLNSNQIVNSISIPDVKSSIAEDIDYKRGYFISAMLGDGSFKKYVDKNGYDMFKVRFVVSDIEINDYFEELSSEFGFDFYRYPFKISESKNIIVDGLFGNKREQYNNLLNFIDTHNSKNVISENYARGFLSGIYDTEGSINVRSRVIRIFNKDISILDKIKQCLDLLDIRYVEEIGNCTSIRIKGKHQNFKFISTVKPKCYRKGLLNFLNSSVFTKNCRILNIEKLEGEIEVYNIGTSTKTYIANGICVHNCYEKDKTSEYNWDEVKSFIDAIVENSPDKVFGIEFLGGEPMIGFEYIKKSVEYLENTDDVTVTNYGITTNGTIVHDELIDLMKKYDKVSWAASMDGNVFMNQMRIMKDTGENSHDIVLENHKKLTDIFGTGRASIHMVTHPYNIAYLRQGIQHLYDHGVRSIGVGTIENTMTIGKEYCDCYIRELDMVSQDIVDGKLPRLRVDVLDSMKPRSDKRHYIKDPKTGKTIAESYGRAGDDVTKKADTEKYNVISPGSPLGTLIEDIREIVYRNHQQRLREVG